MAWVKAYELKPFAIFDVEVGETFNVKDRIGSNTINNVEIVFAFKDVKTETVEYDATPVLKGSFPNYSIHGGIGVLPTSIVNVFVYAV